ncbi:hypothetical protein GN316_09520 [Xylophilus sp. Kf1]|nr:hypothetical protein [Xylophilus sp. Kf1]
MLGLRATLADSAAQGEGVVGQRGFVLRRPATSPDAPRDEIESRLALLSPRPP